MRLEVKFQVEHNTVSSMALNVEFCLAFKNIFFNQFQIVTRSLTLRTF